MQIPSAQEIQQRTWLRDELLALLSVSGTLAGLCITGVTVFHSPEKKSLTTSIVDDTLAFAALLFLVCTYLIFIGLRSKKPCVALWLEKLIDALFLLGLTTMVFAGFVMVYTLW